MKYTVEATAIAQNGETPQFHAVFENKELASIAAALLSNDLVGIFVDSLDDPDRLHAVANVDDPERMTVDFTIDGTQVALMTVRPATPQEEAEHIREVAFSEYIDTPFEAPTTLQ